MSDFFDISVLENKQQPPPDKKQAIQENIFNREITLFKKPFPDKAKEAFYIELATLLEAGLDMKTCLQLLAEEQGKKGIRAIIEEVLGKIIQGSSLSASLKSSKHFTPYEYYSVQIGEETGRLVVVMKQLGLFFKKKIAQRRQVIGALTYPLIVLSIAMGAIFFMLNYVVPMFSDVFRRFGGDLPFLTQMVLRASLFARKSAFLFILVITGVFVFCHTNRKKIWFRRYSAALLLRIPFVKDMLLKSYMARFTGTMALLTGAKVPLLQALELTRKMIEFYPLVIALEQIEGDILKGLPLHRGLESIPLFPRKLVTMVKVGEEVNQLEQFFGKISDQYGEDLEYQSAMLGKFIEPMIILLLGIIVGLVLVAMYLPLFNMGDIVH